MPRWWESVNLDGSCLPSPAAFSVRGDRLCRLYRLRAGGASRTALASWGSVRGSASRISGCISSPEAGGPHPRVGNWQGWIGTPEATRG